MSALRERKKIMTSEQYFAMKYYEDHRQKTPSERYQEAVKMWEQGSRLIDINRETDMWTHLPDTLLYLQNGDHFYVDGAEYELDGFDLYDNFIVTDAYGNEYYHNAYGARGDDFLMRAELERKEESVKEYTENLARGEQSREEAARE